MSTQSLRNKDKISENRKSIGAQAHWEYHYHSKAYLNHWPSQFIGD